MKTNDHNEYPVDLGLLGTRKRAKQDEEIAADIEVVFKTHRNLNALGIALNQKSEIKLQQISCCVNLIQQNQAVILLFGWIDIQGVL